MGCGVTFTSCIAGAAPVTAPVPSTGKTTWFMNTFHTCPVAVLLGSRELLSPYHTASARPAPPAWPQGKTLTWSPVEAMPSLTCTGVVQVFHLLAALAADTHTWRSAGVELLPTQNT